MILSLSFGPLLKRQIKRFTNQTVELEYENSHARLLKGTIELQNAILTFHNVALDSSSQIQVDRISFDKFQISHLSIKSLLFDRSFKIDKVLLSGPKIKFEKDTIINQGEFISNLLSPDVVSRSSQSAPFSFEIEEVEIDQGSFNLMNAGRKDFSIGNLKLKLQNISMDDLKALNGNDLDLNAQFNILLSVYNIQKELADDSRITIDSVVYKKSKRLFMIGGIHLLDVNTSNAYAESKLALNGGLVSIKGFSLSHFLSSKDVKFSSLTISDTEVFERLNYNDEIKPSAESSSTESILFPKLFKAFITDTLMVRNLNYRSENNYSDSANYINNLNVWLYSITVDSTFISNKEYLSPLYKSNIVSGPIDIHMPEIGLDVFSDSITHWGYKKEQIFSGLRLDKYPSLFSGNTDQSGFQLIADSLIVSGLDEREWIDSLVLEISLQLKNPYMSGSNVFLGKSELSKTPILLPEKVVLNNLDIINGNIDLAGSVGEEIESESLTMHAEDLEFSISEDSTESIIAWRSFFTSLGFSKLLIPGKLQVQMDGLSFKRGDLLIDGIFYTNRPSYGSSGISISNSVDTSRFFLSRLEASRFDLRALINNRELSIESLIFLEPDYFQFAKVKEEAQKDTEPYTPLLIYRRINELLPQYFSSVDLGEVSISDALAQYQLDQDAIDLQMRLDGVMKGLLFVENEVAGEPASLLADYYEFCITDAGIRSDKFQIGIDSISYDNSLNHLAIINSQAHNQVQNGIINQDDGIKYRIVIPKLVLTEPDFVPNGGGPISFEDFYVFNPDIHIHLKDKEEDTKKSISHPEVLPFTFFENDVIIKDGKFSLLIESDTDSAKLLIGNIGLEAQEIYKIIGLKEYRSGSKNIFDYASFNLTDISLSGSGMSLDVKKVIYNQKNGVVSIIPFNQKIFPKNDEGKSTGSLSTIDIPEINIEYPDLLIIGDHVKSLGVRNILIPDVNVAIQSNKIKDSDKKPEIRIADNDSSLRNILGKFEFLHIDSIAINDIGITHHNIADTAGGTFDIQRVSLIVDELRIDSSNFAFHEKRLAKDIILKLHDKELITSDSLYLLKANDITYYYSKDKLVVDSFEVVPRFDRKIFFERVGTQTDLFQMKFESATAEGIDLISIIENKELEIKKVTLNKFHLMDHRDKHYARIENDFKKLPKQALFNLPFSISLDTVQLNDSFILYGEYVDKSPEPGEIYFTNFNASIYNVSNFIKKDQRYNSMQASINSDIMDKAKMNVNITMPLAEDDDAFWFSGHVEETNLTHFNSMTENLFGISIVRGRGGVDIPLITLNDSSSKGSLYFKYKKLKLAMYNRNKAKMNRGLGSGLVDLLMNGILVKSNNPTFLGKTRTGDVYSERNTERSFFNYLWKSTMSGLMATMGFYNKELRGEKRERKYEEKIERKDDRQIQKVKY